MVLCTHRHVVQRILYRILDGSRLPACIIAGDPHMFLAPVCHVLRSTSRHNPNRCRCASQILFNKHRLVNTTITPRVQLVGDGEDRYFYNLQILGKPFSKQQEPVLARIRRVSRAHAHLQLPLGASAMWCLFCSCTPQAT